MARDGPDAGDVDGDDPSEVKPLFHSDAKYYEPAGAVSWDVSMMATRPDWRIRLKGGDTVSIDATYDVRKASWYESMGILPLAVSNVDDPAARDPFDDAADVQAMYDKGGILTHGRLPENIDAKANDDLKLPDPRKLDAKGKVPKTGIDIDGFRYQLGGYSAFRGFPGSQIRPPLVKSGQGVSFTNLDALPGEPDEEQAWHSVTSCKAPCNRDSGIGYPLAERADQVRLRPARLRHVRLHRGDDAVERVHDAPAEGSRQDLHVLLPDPPVHARVGPRAGQQEEELTRLEEGPGMKRRILGTAGAIGVAAVLLTAGGAPAKGTKTVDVGDDFFSPKSLEVKKGTKVAFDWVGVNEHDVAKGKGPGKFFNSGPTEEQGVNFTRKFKDKGKYTIICTLHSDMTMKLKVK